MSLEGVYVRLDIGSTKRTAQTAAIVSLASFVAKIVDITLVKLRHVGQGGICRWRMWHSSQRTPAARVAAPKGNPTRTPTYAALWFGEGCKRCLGELLWAAADEPKRG